MEPDVAGEKEVVQVLNEFQRDLEAVLRKHNKGTECNMPAFILARNIERHIGCIAGTIQGDSA